MEEQKNSKEIVNEKKTNIDNKNEFHALFTTGVSKKKASTEIKESTDKPDILTNNSKANYLNTLLKKSFFNTINKTNDNESLNKLNTNQNQKPNDLIFDENSNSKLYYSKKKPQNFIPSYLFDNININKNKKINRQKKNELRDVLDLYDKQKNNMKQYENDLIEARDNLKKAKEAKRKILEEVYEIKKEIENINNNENNNNNALNRSRLSLQVNNMNNIFKSLNQGQSGELNKENENKKNELDKEIREYEDKISKLKYDNRDFMESYDILYNDYKKNLDKNLKLNNCIFDIDKKTKAALKEKDDLKKYIDKFGKI